MTVSGYEQAGHQHRGHSIGMARHGTYAPFACNAPLKLTIEDSQRHRGAQIVTERCQCGRVVNVYSVLVELDSDEQDDCA